MNTDKVIKAIFDEFLNEIRANDGLRERITKLIQHDESISGKVRERSRRRNPALFNPMDVYFNDPDKLQSELDKLDVEQLKDIVAEQGMDRAKLAMKWKSKERLTDLILSTVRSRSQKGDVFRRPSLDGGN